VIECRWLPGCRRVAIVTGVGRCKVPVVLARGARAIVTCEAGTRGNTCMVKAGWLPGVGVVAVFADIAGALILPLAGACAPSWQLRHVPAACV
jgi:hypothetical protein